MYDYAGEYLMKYNASISIMITFLTFTVFAQNADTLTQKSIPVRNDSIRTAMIEKKFLAITTTPDSAVVVIDDSIRGLSPLKLCDLNQGEHVILIKKKGYYQKRITVAVDTANVQELSFSLQQPGALVIQSTPAGADAFVNDEKRGVTPLVIPQLKPGNYSVKLEKTTYDTFEKTVAVTSGKKDTLVCSLVINKAYADSVKNASAKLRKKHSRFKTILITGAFCLFAIVIGSIELSGDK
jgi:hypothetical protein